MKIHADGEALSVHPKWRTGIGGIGVIPNLTCQKCQLLGSMTPGDARRSASRHSSTGHSSCTASTSSHVPSAMTWARKRLLSRSASVGDTHQNNRRATLVRESEDIGTSFKSMIK
ncbi:MAG: hypothetical protein K8R57_07420 [Verrucomicrobia bacterium]|nr:hypothetical protein [Verrucomicrobiota bacterium]